MDKKDAKGNTSRKGVWWCLADYFDFRKAARSRGDFLESSSGVMGGLFAFVGALTLEDVANTGVEGGSLGCEFLENLRDFKSEALVVGHCATLFLDAEAEGGPVVGAGM